MHTEGEGVNVNNPRSRLTGAVSILRVKAKGLIEHFEQYSHYLEGAIHRLGLEIFEISMFRRVNLHLSRWKSFGFLEILIRNRV